MVTTNIAATVFSRNARTEIPATADTDQARGAALQEAFAIHQPGDRIQMGAGPFEVTQHLPLNIGSSFVGLGMNASSVRIADLGPAAQSCCIVMSKDWSANQSHTYVGDILFDCNMQGQSAANLAIGAVDIGNTTVIERARAIHWATKGNGPENFVFIVGSGVGQGGVQGGKILNCYADTPAPIIHGPNNITLFDFWANADAKGSPNITPDWAFGCEIAGCVVHDITCGPGIGQPRGFVMFTTGQSYGFNLHHNIGYNIRRVPNHNQEAICIYSDTFSIRHAAIRDNVFLNVMNGLFFQIGNPRPGCVVDRLAIERNIFDCNADGNGWALVNTDEYGSISSQWTVRDNYLGGYFQLRGTGHFVTGNTICRNFSMPATVATWRDNIDQAGHPIGFPVLPAPATSPNFVGDNVAAKLLRDRLTRLKTPL